MSLPSVSNRFSHTNGKVEEKIATQSSQPTDTTRNLLHILTRASFTGGGLVFHSPSHNEKDQPKLLSHRISYAELLADAAYKAHLICRIDGLSPSSIVLLHFDTQLENIQWFWAATLAGVVPAISPPFVNDKAQRLKHLEHLRDLLNNPIVLTSNRLIPEFLDAEKLSLHNVESLQYYPCRDAQLRLAAGGLAKTMRDVAVLMLTSGSTGTAKAVPLRHGQIIKAVQSKSSHHGIEPRDAMLNWVGIDHVASLTEIHLHAMRLGSDQHHVPASELLRDPLQFIRLLDTHKIAYTFAPNFFLSMVRDRISANPGFTANLSSLKALISGGESNVVTTCDELTRELRKFGIRGEVIRPGFGMTETCAGSIYSRQCPSYDLAKSLEFATLGSCIPGIHMRIMSASEPYMRAVSGEVGDLQVCGPLVFDHYYNNPKATNESFTPDGWFITGDLAWIDDNGNLNIAGRSKDTIIVNGVKWNATELETAIEEEGIAGLLPSFTVAFPTRAPGSPTEDIAIIYSPTYEPDNHHARYETAAAIIKTVGLITGRKPAHLIPLPSSMIEKSSLGKISRSKARTALEKGEYANLEREDQFALESYRALHERQAETETERAFQKVLASLLEIPAEHITMNASIFDLGITSFNLILLKSQMQKELISDADIPMSIFMTKPSVAEISLSIDQLLSQPIEYNPIVPLQLHGSGTPLFCIHPGSGDILVFIALAAHFSTRPIYAIRTRGYNANERLFYTIEETAETYVKHIRETQPEGPYAIAGYSLGSTLAYEVAKILERQGSEVRFLASIDYPPHIALYVRGLNWIDVLLHIAFFLELIDEPVMVEITPYMHTLDRNAAIAHILAIGDAERATALAVDAERLALISDIAENFRVNAETYEPIGKVENLDVFVADPPTYAADGRKDWRENKLGRWTELCKNEVEFHDCPGIHAKMLSRDHIAAFAKILKAAMRRRGV